MGASAATVLANGADAAEEPMAETVSDAAIRGRQRMIIEAIAGDPSFSPKKRNGKYQHAIGCCRLALNPKDEAVLRWIEMAASEDDDFAYQGLATVFAHFGDDWQGDLREAVRKSATSWKKFLGGGTENMVAMCRCAGLVFGERFPQDKFQYGLTGSELAEACKRYFRKYGKAVFGGSMVEYLSPIYVATNTQAWVNVADRAHDEEAKFLAGAILDWMMVDVALNSFEGATVAPVTREKGLLTGTWQKSFADTNTQWLLWMYFGLGNTADEGGAFAKGREPYKPPPGYHAVSGWLPHPVIRNIGVKNVSLPYSIRQSRGGWGYIQPTMVNAFGKKGADNRDREGLDTARYHFRSAYIAENYAVGAGYFRADPEEPLTSTDVPFSVCWKSKSANNFLLVQHPYWHVGLAQNGQKALGDDDWLGISPFGRMVHHENAALVLYDLPEKDPYLKVAHHGSQKFAAERPEKLIHAVFVYLPETVEVTLDEGGCFFVREGDVYIGIRPLTDGAEWVKTAHEGFIRLRIPGALTGVALEIGDREEHRSFADFRRHFMAAELKLAGKRAIYRSTRGDRLEVAPVAGSWLPEAAVNGAALDFEAWPICESPWVNCRDGVLDLNDGHNGFSIDWSGESPVYADYSLSAEKKAVTKRRLLRNGRVVTESA